MSEQDKNLDMKSKWLSDGYLFDANKKEKFKKDILDGKDYEEVIHWITGQVALFGAFMEYNGLSKKQLLVFAIDYSNFIWEENETKAMKLIKGWMREYRRSNFGIEKFLNNP